MAGTVSFHKHRLLESNLVQDVTSLFVLNQVNKPLADPILLKSHEGEVTAVDWYMILTPNGSGPLFSFTNK